MRPGNGASGMENTGDSLKKAPSDGRTEGLNLFTCFSKSMTVCLYSNRDE